MARNYPMWPVSVSLCVDAISILSLPGVCCCGGRGDLSPLIFCDPEPVTSINDLTIFIAVHTGSCH